MTALRTLDLRNGNTFAAINPATGESLAEFDAASPVDVMAAVREARGAADEWRAVPVRERRACVRRFRRLLAARADDLADVIAAETGKPRVECYGAEILPSEAAAGFLLKNADSVLRPRRLSRSITLHAEPYGVVGVISTWNYPLFLAVAPLLAALTAGNAVVWKPSEMATLVAVRIHGLLLEAGFPPETVQMVPGGPETGRALVRAGCDKISFTGGAETGRAILAELAKTGTPSVMELSGNDAAIVCGDADVRLAAESIVWGRVSNGGQSCVAPQRIYVHRDVFEEFLAHAGRRTDRVRREEQTPLRTEELRLRCHRLVRAAVEDGARLLAGGFVPEGRGWFYPPTLLADCRDDMDIMREDFFGPVVAVSRVESDEEAVQRANDSDMGLGASVWTRSLARRREMAGQLRVGLVSVNSVLLDAADPRVPFGGIGASGFGKTRGGMGLEELVHWKAVAVHSRPPFRHLFPYVEAAERIVGGLAGGRTNRVESVRRMIGGAMNWARQVRERDAEGGNLL